MRIYHAELWIDGTLTEHAINVTNEGTDLIETQIEPSFWETMCSAASHHSSFESVLRERPVFLAAYRRLKGHQRKELREWLATQVGAS